MKYLAIDVETANSDYSICQIGIAEFQDGVLTDTWTSLVNPEDYFDDFNVWLHRIDEEMVQDAPTFPEIYSELQQRLSDQVTVHHMPFDRVAISRACEEYDCEPMDTTWLDSAKVARRTWEQFAYKGFGLANLAAFLNISFQHHDALQDAIVAGKLLHEACAIKAMAVDDWVIRCNQPLMLYKDGSTSIKLDGNPEGPFYGENLVFTGALPLTRAEAGKLASDLGCNVTNSITKTTTMLVVGIQADYKLAGYEKSSKHRKAEDLIKKGLKIKILSERDFQKMIEIK